MFILLLSLCAWAISGNIVTALIIFVFTMATKEFIRHLEVNYIVQHD